MTHSSIEDVLAQKITSLQRGGDVGTLSPRPTGPGPWVRPGVDTWQISIVTAPTWPARQFA